MLSGKVWLFRDFGAARLLKGTSKESLYLLGVDSNTNAISAKIPMQSRNKYVVATKTFQSKREIKAVEPYEKRNCSQ